MNIDGWRGMICLRGDFIMYNIWMSIFAIVLGTIGTIKTILSILKMRLKDIIYQRSALGQDTEELSILQQVYDARVGIVWVILSGILQVIEKLYGEMNCILCCIVFAVTIGFALVWWLSMFCIYKRARKKLEEAMSEELKNSLNERNKK